MEELFTTPRKTVHEIFEKTKAEYILLENVQKGAQEWDGYNGFRASAGYQKLKCLRCGYIWDETAGTYKHKEKTRCPECGNEASALNLKKYRNPLEFHENLVVITAENPESVWVECLRMNFTLPVRFGIEETEESYEISRRALFHLTPGKAEKWKASYSYMLGNSDYVPVKKIGGFKFITGNYGQEEGALLFGREALSGTFLKYANPERWKKYTNSAWNVTEYLVNFARYPVYTEFIEKTKGIRETAPLDKWDRRINYRKAETAAALFPRLDKEKLRILIRLIRGGGDVSGTYDAVEKNPPELIRRAERFAKPGELPLFLNVCEQIKRKPEKLGAYLKKQEAGLRIYSDYLGECVSLGYDLADEAVLFPKSLLEKHAETSDLVRYRATPELLKKSEKRAEALKKSGAAYRHGRLAVVIPRDFNAIVEEGARLSHCVGSYAQDHAEGRTTILFIRKRGSMEKPFFTLEIDMKSGEIRQCYGYKNRTSDRDNLEVGQFLEHYRKHLAYMKTIKKPKGRKTA